MVTTLLDRLRQLLRRWLDVAPAAPGQSPEAAILRYETALANLSAQPDSFLAALLARDAVAQAGPKTEAQIEQVAHLDTQLQQAGPAYLAHLPGWRQVVAPPEAAWWWFLDEAAERQRQKSEQREQEKDLPWVIATGILMLFTTTLAVDLIRRLWTEAPDISAIFGTLLTLLLTASPLTKRGPELVTQLLKRIPGLTPRFRAEAATVLAALAFVLVLALWWFGRPQWAVLYNNRGIAALEDQGNVTAAAAYFQSAGALDPTLAVPYQNLAGVYNSIGQPETALEWYEQAIASDHRFGPAFAGASHLHNEQGDFEQAITVALAGLQPDNQAAKPDVALKAQYDLLANLGRAYFEQEQYQLAEKALAAAVALEPDLTALEPAAGGSLRSALPHIYLAQLWEQQDEPDQAKQAWREALRHLDTDRWDHQPWLNLVQEHLK